MEYTPEEKQELCAQIEAILFASGDPVGVERLCLGLSLTKPEADALLEEMMSRYEFAQGGLRIIRINESYQMCSAPEFASTVRAILETRAAPKLSPPALEVLAVVAYHQPTTRAYVDQVRGVDSTYTVTTLVERGLLETCGRLDDMPGRPSLYRTTETFLRVFHLESLSHLPDLEEEEELEQLRIPTPPPPEPEPENDLEQERFL